MDPVDTYIAKAASFAQPILRHFRALVHKTCPHATEAIKWGMPYFETYGTNLCGMAAFRQHCAVIFWKAALLEDKMKLLDTVGKTGMGHLGKLTSLEEMPADKLLAAYLKEADKLNKENVKVAPPKAGKPQTLKTPPELAAALKKNKAAAKTFDAFSYTNKKDYIEWITEAKTDATRQKRLDTAIEWMAEGKIRNWKYLNK